jgi:signal peptidase II
VAELAARSNARLLFWPTLVLVATVVADQVTKVWAVEALTNRPPMQVLGDFLQFTLVYNEGGALGTQIGPASYYLIASLLIMCFVVYYAWINRENVLISIPLGLIAGGAIGNIIDRFRIGRVVDFIDVDFFDIHAFGFHLERFWTFNIADSAISCSIVFLAIVMFFHPDHAAPSKQNSTELTTDNASSEQPRSSTGE